MKAEGKISVIDIIALYYTLVVMMSCTVIGHIHSNIFGVMFLTIAVLVAAPLCLISYALQSRMIFKPNLIQIPLIIYTIIYVQAITRGVNTIESYLPLISLLACAYIGGKYVLKIEIVIKWFEGIGLLASALLLLQSFYHAAFGGHIQMLPLSILSGDQITSYSSTVLYGFHQNSGVYRPSAFFLEPSHFVHFAIISLVFFLFANNHKTRIKEALFVTLALIATISSTGLALLLIVWGLWGITGQSSNNMPRWVKMFIIFVMILGAVLMIVTNSTSTLGIYLQRILPSNLINLADSQQGRYWANRYLNSFSSQEWLIGRGVGTAPPGYYMGYVRIIYQIGIVGFISYIMVILAGMIKGNKISKIVALLYIILLFGAEFDVYRYIILYISILFAGIYKNEIILEENIE